MTSIRTSLRFAIIFVIAFISVPTAFASDSGTTMDQEQGVSIPTPHEVHEYQQIKYLDPEDWTCHMKMGCLVCKNETDAPLIAEVKANYKREIWFIRTDTQEVREHCVNPEQEIWACLNTNMVIEPEPGKRPDSPSDASTCPVDY